MLCKLGVERRFLLWPFFSGTDGVWISSAAKVDLVLFSFPKASWVMEQVVNPPEHFAGCAAAWKISVG